MLSDGTTSNYIPWSGTSSSYTTCYTDSQIRAWLNSTSSRVTVGEKTYKGFLGQFTYTSSKVKGTNINSLCSVCTSSSYGGSSCKHYYNNSDTLTTYAKNRGSGDKIFLLSQKDAETYFHYNSARKKTGGDTYWWLRSCRSSGHVRNVNSDGNVSIDPPYYTDYGFAPALFLSI